MSQETQEKKSERASAAVTATEKRKLDWLADTLELHGELEQDGGVSQLMRRYSINDALTLADNMLARQNRADVFEFGHAADDAADT